MIVDIGCSSCQSNRLVSRFSVISHVLAKQTELEKEKSRKDGGDSAWIERTRQTEAELDWAKEMADRLDRVNQGLSRENLRLKSQFKSQEEDRKFLIRQLVAIKVGGVFGRDQMLLFVVFFVPDGVFFYFVT